jgi:hypothetical protein
VKPPHPDKPTYLTGAGINEKEFKVKEKHFERLP